VAKKYPQLGKILKKLLFDRDMKAVDLAREVNIPQPTVHRLITGKSTRPYKSSLQPIADYFSVTVDQLVGEEPVDQAKTNEAKSLTKSKIKAIPLLAWKALGNMEQARQESTKEIAVTQDVSDHSFALIMTDSSMEPLFPRGSILIFNPDITARDRNYVLVKSHVSGTYVFRQLLIDLEHKYIKSLNPDLSTSRLHLLSDEDKIMGCLIESRNNYLQSDADGFIEGGTHVS